MATRGEVVGQLQAKRLSKRQALRPVGMSPRTLRYEPRDDGNAALPEKLKALGRCTSRAYLTRSRLYDANPRALDRNTAKPGAAHRRGDKHRLYSKCDNTHMISLFFYPEDNILRIHDQCGRP